MQKSKQPVFVILVLLATLVLTACGDTATTVPATTAATTAAAVATTVASGAATTAAGGAATTAAAAAVGTVSAEVSTNPADYGLKPNKPYNGTKLNFLICCNTASQFASLIDKTQKEFTAMTGIAVTWDNVPYNGFQQKLLTEAVSGTGGFDNVAWVDSWGPGIKQFLVPLNDRVKAANINTDDFAPAHIKAASSDDGKTLYGIPFRGHAQVLFYRKDIFQKLGLQPPTTWQELDKVSQTLKEKNPATSPISAHYGINAGQNIFLWLNHLWGNGGDVFDQGNKPVFNSPAAVEATTAYLDLLKKGYSSANSVTFNEGEAGTQFSSGKAAMFAAWSWYYGNFTNPKNVAPEVLNNIGVVPAPSWTGKPPITYSQIWPVGISKFSKNQDAAWEYLQWLTSARIEKRVALDKSKPEFDNVVTVHNSNLQDADVNKVHQGLQNTMFSVLKTARTQPLLPEWPQIESILEVAINNMASGKPVQATLDQAQKDVDAIMKKGGYYK